MLLSSMAENNLSVTNCSPLGTMDTEVAELAGILGLANLKYGHFGYKTNRKAGL